MAELSLNLQIESASIFHLAHCRRPVIGKSGRGRGSVIVTLHREDDAFRMLAQVWPSGRRRALAYVNGTCVFGGVCVGSARPSLTTAESHTNVSASVSFAFNVGFAVSGS
jgi:hypothetical protein